MGWPVPYLTDRELVCRRIVQLPMLIVYPNYVVLVSSCVLLLLLLINPNYLLFILYFCFVLGRMAFTSVLCDVRLLESYANIFDTHRGTKNTTDAWVPALLSGYKSMTESERTVHYNDLATLIDSSADNLGHVDPVSHLGHPDPVRDVQKMGSINTVHSSEAERHCYQRLSASVSSTASSVVPLLHVYRRRWYILFIFTTLSLIQVQMFKIVFTVFFVLLNIWEFTCAEL